MDVATVSPRDLLVWVKEIKNARGMAFLMAKGHRLTGILLSLYLIIHIYTMSGLEDPVSFQEEMNLFKHPVFMFLEWCLLIPLAFHAFNGGRLILFELFGRHDDDRLVQWSLTLGVMFTLFMGVLMMWGTQSVSTFLFWSLALIVGAILICFVWQRVWPTHNNLIWKFQRLTGALLLPLALGHYLFMHLNASTGHESSIIIERMKNPAMLFVDLILLTTVMLHGWYGVQTIIHDIVSTSWIKKASTFILAFITIIIFYLGIRLLLLMLSLS